MLNGDGVFWVTRSKESLCFRVVKKLPKATDKRILSDELVVLKNKGSRANYPEPMRRVRRRVKIRQNRPVLYSTVCERCRLGHVGRSFHGHFQSQAIVRIRVDEMELRRPRQRGRCWLACETLPPTGTRPVFQSKPSSQSQGDALGFDFADAGLLSGSTCPDQQTKSPMPAM